MLFKSLHNNNPDKRGPVTDWFEVDSRNTLESLMQIFEGMVFRCAIDKDWTMLLIGGGCTNLTGYEPHELLGNRFVSYNEITHPDDRDDVFSSIHGAIKHGTPYRIEYRILCRNGQEKWVLERGSTCADEHGVQVLQGFIEDITSQVTARAKLTSAEARYRSIFENSAEGIFQTTADGHYLTANPALARIYGYASPTELLAVLRNVGTQLYVDSRCRDVFIRLMKESGRVDNFEVEVHQHDGTVIWIAESARAVYGNDGEFLYYEGTVQDITRRKQAEATLHLLNKELEDRVVARTIDAERARDTAERANQAKSQFLSSMSHELRTPLNAILGFAQLFEYDKTLTTDQKTNAKEIDKAGHHLLSLINEVLDLAKIESGHIELSMESISLIKIIEECNILIAPLATSHSVSLDFILSQCSNLFVKADYTRLKQVILNLMSNAVKYNRRNGYINVSCTVDNPDAICISISDSGHGIPDEKLSNLFQPFSRLGAEFGDIEGTGIGLVITKQLVELMGGRIGVNSTVGKGTTFWVELKTALTGEHGHAFDDVDNKLDMHDSRGKLSAQDGSQARILIAEDNAANQAVFRQQMELLGYPVDIAENGFKALGHWQHGNYDLLLTDINMPLMNGYELVEKIRKAEKNTEKHIPILAITANAMEEDTKRCLESGMDGFIAKPVRLDDLKSALQQWLPKQESSKTDSMQLGNESAAVEGKANADNETAVDISMLKGLVGDDPEKHCLLFKSFIDSAPEIIQAIQTAHKNHAAEPIMQQAHKLRSSARSMGAHELADACQVLEIAGKADNWGEIDDWAPQLNALFQSVNIYLDDYCGPAQVIESTRDPSVDN